MNRTVPYMKNSFCTLVNYVWWFAAAEIAKIEDQYWKQYVTGKMPRYACNMYDNSIQLSTQVFLKLNAICSFADKIAEFLYFNSAYTNQLETIWRFIHF